MKCIRLGMQIGETIAKGIRDGQKAAGQAVVQGARDLAVQAKSGWDSIDWTQAGFATARSLAIGMANGRGLISGAVNALGGHIARTQAEEQRIRTPNRGPNNGRVTRKRAAGGSTMRGVPHLVGERGPEMFVPGRTGRILTAGATAALLASSQAAASALGSSLSGLSAPLPSVVGEMASRAPRAAPMAAPNITINIYGATDPQAVGTEVRRQVHEEFARLAREQRGLYSD